MYLSLFYKLSCRKWYFLNKPSSVLAKNENYAMLGDVNEPQQRYLDMCSNIIWHLSQ